jgi:hypothetical protein
MRIGFGAKYRNKPPNQAILSFFSGGRFTKKKIPLKTVGFLYE